MGSMCTGERVFFQHLQLGHQLSTPHSLFQLWHLHSKHKDVEGAILTATGHKMALTCGQSVQAVDTTAVSLESQAGAAQPWKKMVVTTQFNTWLSALRGGGTATVAL